MAYKQQTQRLLNNRNVYTINTSNELTEKLHSLSPADRNNLVRKKLENYGFMNIENQERAFLEICICIQYQIKDGLQLE